MKQLIALQLLLATILTAPTVWAKPDEYRTPQQNREQNCKNKLRAIAIGSSVTMGFFGDSPSMLYLQHTGQGPGNQRKEFSNECIIKIDFPIRDSKDLMGDLKAAVNKGFGKYKPDLVVAVDLLIHDVTFTRQPGKIEITYQDATDTINYLASLQIPVLIGSVFSSEPNKNNQQFQIPLARRINQQLCIESSKAGSNLHILPITRIYREIYSGQFKMASLVKAKDLLNGVLAERISTGDLVVVQRQGDKFVLVEENVPTKDIMTDFYHPGPRGAYMMANQMMRYTNSLYSNGRFNYSSRLFKRDKILGKDKHNDLAIGLFKAIEEDDKYSLDLVDETTIPTDMGDETCTQLLSEPLLDFIQ